MSRQGARVAVASALAVLIFSAGAVAASLIAAGEPHVVGWGVYTLILVAVALGVGWAVGDRGDGSRRSPRR